MWPPLRGHRVVLRELAALPGHIPGFGWGCDVLKAQDGSSIPVGNDDGSKDVGSGGGDSLTNCVAAYLAARPGPRTCTAASVAETMYAPVA